MHNIHSFLITKCQIRLFKCLNPRILHQLYFSDKVAKFLSGEIDLIYSRNYPYDLKEFDIPGEYCAKRPS